PNLKDHAPEVPDLVVDPDVRREPLAGDVRAEFDRRRGLRTESRGVVDTIQPERMPAETRIPFDRGLLVRRVRPRLAAQRSAWNPSASWSTAITSGFERIVRVASDMLRTSLPAMSGADMRAHIPRCVRYSPSVMPPLPTSSISGSLYVPGAVAAACATLRSTMDSIVPQSSEMSPDMRH